MSSVGLKSIGAVLLINAERDAIIATLARLDRASDTGPWTAAVLHLIDRHPGRRAADLAEQLGDERDRFKRRVRRLKALGLTESLEVGYRATPRYRSLLEGSDGPGAGHSSS